MKSSQTTGLWAAGAGVLAVLLVVATYFLVIAPKRSEAADLKAQRVTVEQTNAEIQQRTAQLRSQFATLGEKREQLAAIESELPSAADVPALIHQVSGYAATSGVSLDQITPGAPQAYTDSTSGTGKAATPASGIVAIPLTITVSGSFAQVELYVKNLQVDMTRHFSITGLTVASDQTSKTAGAVSATLAGQIFVLQGSSSAATAGSAAGTGSATAGAGTTPASGSSSSTTAQTSTATVS